MDKTKALKIINIGLGITLIIQALSGILISFLGTHLPNFIFGLHEANAWPFLLFGILHLSYNWSWVKTQLLKS